MTIGERLLMNGNEATASGALEAGCRAFFGYPITPQSEIMEFMAREMPKVGGVFLQSECELATAGMVYGAAMTGARAMTATAGPGFSLMQEFISLMSWQRTPAVIADICRFGPGTGTAQTAQTDYRQVTNGGGHGGYRCIVLAPASSQECFDLAQLAFYLSDKYRIVVVVLSDGIVGRAIEPVDKKTLELGPLPAKDWAIVGKSNRGGNRCPETLFSLDFVGYHLAANETYSLVRQAEVRYESYQTEDAQLLLVAFGYVARMAKQAVDLARSEGLHVGLVRPITLWPFPNSAIREAASRSQAVLVVEDNSGLMVDDVEAAIQGAVPVHLLGIWGRHQRSGSGIIYPERILQEVRSLL